MRRVLAALALAICHYQVSEALTTSQPAFDHATTVPASRRAAVQSHGGGRALLDYTDYNGEEEETGDYSGDYGPSEDYEPTGDYEPAEESTGDYNESPPPGDYDSPPPEDESPPPGDYEPPPAEEGTSQLAEVATPDSSSCPSTSQTSCLSLAPSSPPAPSDALALVAADLADAAYKNEEDFKSYVVGKIGVSSSDVYALSDAASDSGKRNQPEPDRHGFARGSVAARATAHHAVGPNGGPSFLYKQFAAEAYVAVAGDAVVIAFRG